MVIDDSRKDKCELPDNELIPGGYALVKGDDEGISWKSLEGKSVLVVEPDDDGYWMCFDSLGDMYYFHEDNLLPLSNRDSVIDNNRIYELRYGV